MLSSLHHDCLLPERPLSHETGWVASFECLFQLGLSLGEAVRVLNAPPLYSPVSRQGPSLLLPALPAALGPTPPPLVREIAGCEARAGVWPGEPWRCRGAVASNSAENEAQNSSSSSQKCLTLCFLWCLTVCANAKNIKVIAGQESRAHNRTRRFLYKASFEANPSL
jgi:hypothetical protein